MARTYNQMPLALTTLALAAAALGCGQVGRDPLVLKSAVKGRKRTE